MSPIYLSSFMNQLLFALFTLTSLSVFAQGALDKPEEAAGQAKKGFNQAINGIQNAAEAGVKKLKGSASPAPKKRTNKRSKNE